MIKYMSSSPSSGKLFRTQNIRRVWILSQTFCRFDSGVLIFGALSASRRLLMSFVANFSFISTEPRLFLVEVEPRVSASHTADLDMIDFEVVIIIFSILKIRARDGMNLEARDRRKHG